MRKGFATVKHTTTGTYVIIAVAAVVLVLIAFSRRAAVEAVYPVERAVQFVKRSVLPRMKGAVNGPGYAAENVRLRREVSALSMLPSEIDRLERENAKLRRSLDYASREPRRWVAAPVLSDHCGASGRGRVFRVGRGSADGVVENAVVATPDGLVGLVTGVTTHTCEVTPVTDPTLKVVCAVALGNGRSAIGILEGGDDDELALTHIRGLASDAPQASVSTSGRGGVFPAGFAVGGLVRSSVAENGEWKGVVRPAVDFDNLEDVFIRREK